MCNAHREYFNSLASTWSECMPDEPVLGRLLDRFGIRPGHVVLDAGAGTGRMTVHLARCVGLDGQVVAQDFAWRMLDEGGPSFNQSNVYRICDDLHALACISGSFDRVLCYSVFPHLLDPEKALQEIFRVLKPEGKVLILHTSGSDLLNVFHAQLDSVVNQDILMPAKDMAVLMQITGFKIVDVEENDQLYWVQGQKTNG